MVLKMREKTKTNLYIRKSNPLSLAACKEIFNAQRNDNSAGAWDEVKQATLTRSVYQFQIV